MTTYNTGNPLGSTNPKDLYDNAQNLDNFVNGSDPFYPDRFALQRRSWNGMEYDFDNAQSGRESTFEASQVDKEERFQDFLLSSGYQSLGAYAAGIEFTARNQYVEYLGQFYRPSSSVALPFTTTGVWASDSANLVLLGDDVLRQDIANSTDPLKGTNIVGFKPQGTGAVGRALRGVLLERVRAKDYGATGDGMTVDSTAIQLAYDALPATGGVIEFDSGTYLFSGISGSKPVIFEGRGAFNAGTCFKNNSATAPFFTLTNASGFLLTGVKITSGPSRTAGAYFNFSNVNRAMFEKFFADKYYMFLDHDGGSEIHLDHFQLFDGVANSVASGGGALRFGNTSYTGAISLDNGYIKCTNGALQPAFGILAKFVDGLALGPGLFIIQHGIDIDIAPASGQTASLIKAMGSCIDTADIGMYVRPATGGRVLRCDFVGCWFGAHSVSGVVIDGTAGIVDGVSFIGGEAIANVSTGFNILGTNVDNVDIMGMGIGGNGIGIRITDNANVYVKNNGIGDAGLSGANTTGVALDGTVSGVVTGNEFKSNGTAVSGTPGTAMGVFENGGISNWKSTSVVPTAVSGTITTASGTLRTKKKYDTVEFEYTATVTTNGSGAGGLVLVLPYVPVGAFSGTGRAFGISGKQLQIFANGGASASIYNYDGSYPAASGETITVSGRYITAP